MVSLSFALSAEILVAPVLDWLLFPERLSGQIGIHLATRAPRLVGLSAFAQLLAQ